MGTPQEHIGELITVEETPKELCTPEAVILLERIKGRDRVPFAEILASAEKLSSSFKGNVAPIDLALEVSDILSGRNFEKQQELLDPNKGVRGFVRRRREDTLQRIRGISGPSQSEMPPIQ